MFLRKPLRLDIQYFLRSLMASMMPFTALHCLSCGPAFYVELEPFVTLCLVYWLGVGIVKASLNKGHATLMIHEHNSLLLRSV